MPRVISKHEARNRFRAAKMNEQAMYPAAEQHRREHGAYPSDFIQAQADTSRAFGVYLDAGYFSGITVED